MFKTSNFFKPPNDSGSSLNFVSDMFKTSKFFNFPKSCGKGSFLPEIFKASTSSESSKLDDIIDLTSGESGGILLLVFSEYDSSKYFSICLPFYEDLNDELSFY